MRTRISNVLCAFFIIAVCGVLGMSTTAYAAAESTPLTPPGNLTLVDDITVGADGEQPAAAEGKQFITVVTDSGNFFYLVIDRASGRENVHFMNLVSEEDLLAIMESEKKPSQAPQSTPQKVTPTPKPAVTPAAAPVKSESGGGMTIAIVALLLAGALGGAAYYFKVVKPKQTANTAATTELDGFTFDGDGDEADALSKDIADDNEWEIAGMDGESGDTDPDGWNDGDGIPDYMLPDMPETDTNGGDTDGAPATEYIYEADSMSEDTESEDNQ